MTWTDERVELLKKLWTEGLSASQIAAELGGITRNAVIGKVHRLGLVGPRQERRPRSVPRQRKPRAHSHMMRIARPGDARQHGARADAVYEAELEPEPELIDNIIPIGQRCTILELTESNCRWPIGDPELGGFLLLRRQDRRRPALLQLPLARRLSAGGDRRRDRRFDA